MESGDEPRDDLEDEASPCESKPTSSSSLVIDMAKAHGGNGLDIFTVDAAVVFPISEFTKACNQNLPFALGWHELPASRQKRDSCGREFHGISTSTKHFLGKKS
jgi:hypothetical protein